MAAPATDEEVVLNESLPESMEVREFRLTQLLCEEELELVTLLVVLSWPRDSRPGD